MINNKWKAKPISYDTKCVRSYNHIKYIVIHGTGNIGDTAENNAKHFATNNTRIAGAHYFVDREGLIFKSIPMNKVAWAVGGLYAPAPYYRKCTNYNSVSIELCDITKKKASKKQIVACRKLIKAIMKKCPNIEDVIRHVDVNGKACPSNYCNNKKWNELKEDILYGDKKKENN